MYCSCISSNNVEHLSRFPAVLEATTFEAKARRPDVFEAMTKLTNNFVLEPFSRKRTVLEDYSLLSTETDDLFTVKCPPLSPRSM